MLIFSNSLKRSLKKTWLSVIIKTTVVFTVLLAASIFQTMIVIVVMKILEKYLYKQFSFWNQFLETQLVGINADQLKYRTANMLQRKVFLKEWGGGRELETCLFNFFKGWNLSYLIFSRFTVFTFTDYFTRCKIVLCI